MGEARSNMDIHLNHQDGSDHVLASENLSVKEVTLDRGPILGWIMAANMVPRYLSYVSVISRRYNEW